jgi:putative ABC transport system permease protein
MLGRLLFYLRYANRNLLRSGRWTIFAVFCIAAGVATVVALRSLGLAIGDSLIDNVRASNRGDITLARGSGGGFSLAFLDGENDDDTFTPAEVERLQTWASERSAELTAYKLASNFQLTSVDAVTVGRPQFINMLLVDPATFPVAGEIVATDPPGAPLNTLLTGENPVVISSNLAEQQGLSVGDTVRVSYTTELFTVRGIVGAEYESNLRNPFAAFFGFAYLDLAEAETLQVSPQPNHVSITLPPGSSVREAEASLRAFGRNESYFNMTTVDELLEENQIIADYLGRFIVVMGLGALLIGGVGIINTMLVMVGRRTTEIAALKTFGLKGRQVALLFLSEAFLLGLMGSIVGSVVGILLSGVVNRYGETFLQQKLEWRIYPEAIAFGFVLGLVVTLVFGVLPILTANRVRPATILRPNETVIPRAGIFHSFIALMLVVLVIGGVAGQILGSVPIGMIMVAVTLVVLGVLVSLMWIIVWIVSKFPSFGNVELRLALRNLTARRIRTATTLLALSAGMFALSSITFVGVGTREILQFQLTQSLGGNVLVFPLFSIVSEPLAQRLLDAQLGGIEGIQYNTRITPAGAQVVSINGQEPEMSALGDAASSGGSPVPGRVRRRFTSIPLLVRDSDSPTMPSPMLAGRGLTPEDRGQLVMVAPQTFTNGFFNLNFNVGDRVTIRVSERNYDVEIIGVTSGSGILNTFGQFYVPPDTVEGGRNFSLNVLQVAPEQLNSVLLDLSEIPLIFALDITFIDGLLSRLITQFSAIPTLVGLLSLLAAAVAMANTVSLATLERRRQIGVLKAVGLKGGRVLRIMVLENTLIGLLGGLLGIGLSALGVALMTALGQGMIIPIPREAMPVAVALVIAAVVIAWTATFLSARVAVGERVANVLRYE